jgi:hypothetical protein
MLILIWMIFLVIHCLLLRIMNYEISWIVLQRHLQIVIRVKTPITRCGSVKGSLSSMMVLGIFPRRTKVLFLTRRQLSWKNVACIALSARIPDILIRIAPVARLCMLPLIHLMCLWNLLKVMCMLSLLERIEIMLISLTMALTLKRGQFGCQRPWWLTSKDPNKFGYLKETKLVL